MITYSNNHLKIPSNRRARFKNIELLVWLTYDQGGNVCNGQIEEVDIGSSPHVLIGQDDDTGGEVTKDSNDKEDAVDDGEEEEGFIVDMWVTKYFLNKHGYIFFIGCIW